MKNSALLILMSIIAILVLAACASSLPSQTGGSTITSNPTPGESTSSQSTSSQSSSSQSTSSQSSWNQSSTQQLLVSTTTINNSATIKVQTAPGARITIDLSYCGQNTEKTEYADSTGHYTLSWTPDQKCGGTATAKVTASSDGQSSTSTTSFSVS